MIRLDLTLRETIATLLSRAGIFSFMVVVALTMAFLALAADHKEMLRSGDEYRARVAAGGNIVVATFEDDVGPTASDCAFMTTVSSVQSTGALIAKPPIQLQHLPGLDYSAFEATNSLLDMFDLSDRSLTNGRVYVGPRAATETGLRSGALANITEADGSWQQYTVAESGRVPSARLDRVFLLPLSGDGVVTECWIAFDPASLSSAQSVTRYVLGQEQIATARFESDDPVASLASATQRSTKNLPVAAGVGIGLAGWGLEWLRRSDIALLNVLGFARRELHLSAVIRASSIAMFAVPGALLGVIAFHGPGVEVMAFESLLAQGARMLATAMLVAAANPTILRFEPLVNRLKD